MGTHKKGLSFLFALLLLFTTVPLTAYAAEPIDIMPFWESTNAISATLTISSGTATCASKITGMSGTTKITATVYLQKKNANGTFSTIKTWSGLSSNSILLTFSDTYAVTSGNTYRLKCDAVVTKGGVGESVTIYSSEKIA